MSRVVAGVLLCAVAAGAGAQALHEPAWQAAWEAHRYAGIARQANARLDAHADDLEAWAGLVRAAQKLPDADREAALQRVEGCVQALPTAAVCHYGVGRLLALQVTADGIVRTALNSGRVKDELTRALELDPSLLDARIALVQFHLGASRLAGGSNARARELVVATEATRPEQARLLAAMVEAAAGRLAEASRLLDAVRPGDDAPLAEATRLQRLQLAQAWLADGQVAKARAVFERVVAEHPVDAEARYGLGRALAELKQWDAAIDQYDTASSQPGHDAFPLDYRLGLAWEAKGDPAKARAAYLRSLAAPRRDPQDVADAKARLADLR